MAVSVSVKIPQTTQMHERSDTRPETSLYIHLRIDTRSQLKCARAPERTARERSQPPSDSPTTYLFVTMLRHQPGEIDKINTCRGSEFLTVPFT